MDINKEFWEKVGGSYEGNWINPAKQKLSAKELGWIEKQLQGLGKINIRILDIGVGSGRLIRTYGEYLDTHNGDHSQIHGIDISQLMIDHCRKEVPEAKLERCNIASEFIPFEGLFDFISAIRVLKYNESWRDILAKLSDKTAKNGILAFTMLNSNSADRYALYPVPIHKTNHKEIRQILENLGLEVLEIRGFSRIPDIFYNTLGRFRVGAWLIWKIEGLLENLFGTRLLTRILFIACRK
jgi:SAM-dependent methyltransferase